MSTLVVHPAAGVVDAFLRRQIDSNRTPGLTYAFFNADSVLHRYEGGIADLATGRPVDASTTFHGFSVTKTFTAVAILGLADQGRLELDEPVRRYLPDFSYGDGITVRHLLAHTAGLPNPIPLSWTHPASEDATFDTNAFFSRVLAANPRVKSAPNTKFAYSNLHYIVLGRLIEEVTGQPYRQYILDHLVAPLGLSPAELGFEIGDPARHAVGYHRRFTFSSWLLGWFIDKSKIMGPPQGGWRPFRPFYLNGSAYGGLLGSKDAFVRYVQALLQPSSPIISPVRRREMFAENRTSAGRATGMSLSWFTGELLGRRYNCHAGGGGGYYCEVRIYPEDGLGSVIMFNRTGMTDERFLDQVDPLLLNHL